MAKNEVTIAARQEGDRIVVDLANHTKETVTVVAHPRYFSVELLDERGQFVAGTRTEDPGAPNKKSFVDVGAGKRADGLVTLAIVRDGDAVTVGGQRFAPIPEVTELRVTYKTEALVPNVPSSQRRTLFRGPVQSSRVAIGAAAG